MLSLRMCVSVCVLSLRMCVNRPLKAGSVCVCVFKFKEDVWVGVCMSVGLCVSL